MDRPKRGIRPQDHAAVAEIRYAKSDHCPLLQRSEQYNILQVFQQTVGASIPIAHCNGDQASYNALIAQGLTNVYIHHSATPLGYEVMEDYSPLVGQMHRSTNGSSSYHYDMWLPSLTALNPAIAYPYE